MQIDLTFSLLLLTTTIIILRLVLVHFSAKKRAPTAKELEFKNLSTNKQVKFNSILDPPTCSLSVVIPAYNEQSRLPKMLAETILFLKTSKFKNSYEIILVDDGSKDKTCKIAAKFAIENDIKNEFKILTLEKNLGKGGAVTRVIVFNLGNVTSKW